MLSILFMFKGFSIFEKLPVIILYTLVIFIYVNAFIQQHCNVHNYFSDVRTVGHYLNTLKLQNLCANSKIVLNVFIFSGYSSRP